MKTGSEFHVGIVGLGSMGMSSTVMCPRRSFYLGRRPEQQCLRYVERGWCWWVSDNAATFAEKLDALLVLVVNATQVKQVLSVKKALHNI